MSASLTRGECGGIGTCPKRHFRPLRLFRSTPAKLDPADVGRSAGEVGCSGGDFPGNGPSGFEKHSQTLGEADVVYFRAGERCVRLPDGSSVAGVLLYTESSPPGVCMDETSLQFNREVRDPIPAKAGQSERRNGQNMSEMV